MRINIIDPVLLTDQHLLAEYNEINMAAQSFRRSILYKTGKDIIPKEYTLNSGHVKFFYDKGEYLYRRFYGLKKELKNRTFNVKMEFKNYWLSKPELFQPWEPQLKDYEIIWERIKRKISMKPDWYKYYRNPLDDNFVEFFEERLFNKIRN